MKQIMCVATLACLIMGCEIKVEVPIKRAGVVVASNGEVLDEVLMPGEHIVRTDSEVTMYDLVDEELEDDFDFLFKDVSRGDLKLAIEYSPIADSLPGFYRKYEAHRIGPVVLIKSRSIVRDLFKNYTATEFTKDEFNKLATEAITKNREVTNYVKLHNVKISDLRW